MATLRNPATGKNVTLKPHHWFGRDADVASTCIQEADISLIHALARWDGQVWKLENYSKGETWVNRHRLAFGAGICPKIGDLIQFGALSPSCWVVLSLAPPQKYSAFSGQPTTHAAFYSSTPWAFPSSGPSDILFEFHVSTDEEHVNIHLRYQDQAITLGERVHHYLLLTLARQKIYDARQGQPPCNQGWVRPVQLAAMLNMDPIHLNVHVCRARKQFKAVLPYDGARLIERRVDGIRFGFTRMIVIAGSKLEGQMIDGQFSLKIQAHYTQTKGADGQPLFQMI